MSHVSNNCVNFSCMLINANKGTKRTIVFLAKKDAILRVKNVY
jgi:hypothetical protein